MLRLQHPDGTTTHIWFLPQLHEEVSATALRAAVAADNLDAMLLPETVAEYIRKTGLYAALPLADEI